VVEIQQGSWVPFKQDVFAGARAALVEWCGWRPPAQWGASLAPVSKPAYSQRSIGLRSRGLDAVDLPSSWFFLRQGGHRSRRCAAGNRLHRARFKHPDAMRSALSARLGPMPGPVGPDASLSPRRCSIALIEQGGGRAW